MAAKVRMASRTSTSPLAVPRTVRSHDLTILTSMPAGRMTPVAAIPLLREDSANVRLSMSLQMMETADMLINEVNVTVKAYLVPNLALDRFQSIDDLNRSYEGKSPRDTGSLPVTPFFESRVIPSNEATVNQIHRYLGRHGRTGDRQNTHYIEAYNQIWNFRAANRSKNIPKRTRLQMDLAPAFWHHERFAHIVPDFDQATMDGNVALNIINTKMPIKGLGLRNEQIGTVGTYNARYSDGASAVTEGWIATDAAATTGTAQLVIRRDPTKTGDLFPDVWADLQAAGVTVSLSNIELAKKTQAFAKLREQYTGHSDDYIIDLLMDGISVPEQAWQQPILLAERDAIFGMAQRYATNGADLTKSVVNGATMIDMNIRVPTCPVGGVIMVVAEALPGQLFERGRDPYLHSQNVAAMPQALRDMLDPEPVEAVRNDYIDIDHATPASTFGYAPLNHQWNFAAPCVGGRFFRPKVEAGYSQDRERIWAVEQVNPILSQDFYISRNVHVKPFVNPNQDPFEITAVGQSAITGLTQFGPVLIEASNNYQEVLSEADQTRLTKG